MLSLDALGIYKDEPGTQTLPFPFSLFYPDRGNFVAKFVMTEIKDIPDLGDIRLDGQTLHIGSLATFTDLIESDVVAEHECPHGAAVQRAVRGDDAGPKCLTDLG